MKRSAACLAVFFALHPHFGGCQELWGKAKARLVRQGKALLPRKEELPKVAGVVLGLGLLAHVDKAPSRWLVRNAPKELSLWEPGGRYSLGNAVGVSLLFGGWWAGQSQLTSRGLAFLETNLVTSWVVSALQPVFGRARPQAPHSGQFGKGGSSFPSAHAAHAFGWAGVAWASWPRLKVRWVFPAAALAVALSRVKDRQHFLADVATGAALGWWVGTRLGHSSVASTKGKASWGITPRGLWVAAHWP